MAEIMAWPLNLTTYSYNAQDVMRFMAGKTSGIFGEEGNFQVAAKNGMTVTVQAEGKTGGWLSDGAKYGISFWSANDIDLTVETADGVNPRKDRVVVSWHIPQQATVPDVVIRKGTPSASPQPPALVNNGEYAEICLAEINVPAGATEITSYNITDTRLNEELCGLVSMGVEKIPTDGLEAQFMDWFEDLQTNLDGDVAVNLQNQITGHVSDTEVHLRTLTHSKYGTTHNLAGLSGVSGTVSCVFKATAAFNAGDTIRVDNTGYTIQLSNGEEADDNLFVSGATVAVIVDKGSYRVNFKPAGGVKLPAGTTAIVKVYTASDTFIVPQTGKYKVTAIGKGGKGGNGGGRYAADESGGGGGGGAGGIGYLILNLVKNAEYAITVSSAQSSFGALVTATAGQQGGSGSSTAAGTGGIKGSVSGAQTVLPSTDGASGDFSGWRYSAGGDGGSCNGVAGGKGGAEDFSTIPFESGVGALSTDFDKTTGLAPFGTGAGGNTGSYDSSPQNPPEGYTGAVIIELVLE